jgi:hypothetical protein
MQATMMEGTAAATGTINMLNPLENLSNEVLCLSSESSEKYVPEPHKGQVLQDLLIGIKRFKNAVRWKWFWMEKARLGNEGTLGNKGIGNTKVEEIIEQEEPTQEVQGLGMGLKGKNEHHQLSANSESPSRSFPG